MERVLKYLLASAILLNFSISSFATFLFSTPYPIEVSVPTFPESWYVGAGLAFLQPTATNADLVYGIGNDGSIINAKPGFDWGWTLIDAGYIFSNSGNDINVDYSHLGTQDFLVTQRNVNNAVFTLTLTNLDPSITDFILSTNRLTSKPEFDFNQVDLMLGQFVNIGSRLQLHTSAGLQYSRINQKIDTNSFQTLTGFEIDAQDFAIPVTSSTTLNSTFNGIGPRISFDGDYRIWNGFDLFGQFSSALLVGSITSKFEFMVEEPGGAPGPIDNVFRIPGVESESLVSTGLTSRIVPTMQERIGANYTYWINRDISHITFTLGYQAAEFFNALDYMKTSGNFIRPEPVVFFLFDYIQENTTHHPSDFAFHGPFVNVRVYF